MPGGALVLAAAATGIPNPPVEPVFVAAVVSGMSGAVTGATAAATAVAQVFEVISAFRNSAAPIAAVMRGKTKLSVAATQVVAELSACVRDF
jgi:hypothetical protein